MEEYILIDETERILKIVKNGEDDWNFYRYICDKFEFVDNICNDSAERKMKECKVFCHIENLKNYNKKDNLS